MTRSDSKDAAVDSLPRRGGCDACESWLFVDGFEAGKYKVRIHHDPWCARWRDDGGEAQPRRRGSAAGGKQRKQPGRRKQAQGVAR